MSVNQGLGCHDGTVRARPRDWEGEPIAEAARLVSLLPVKPREPGSRSDRGDCGPPRRAAEEPSERRRSGARSRGPGPPGPGARGSPARRRAPPAPPSAPRTAPRPSPPGSLKSPRTEMGVTAPGTSGNKTQRRPRGGRCGEAGPGTKPARAGPRSPPLPRPHSPAPEPTGSPPPALHSRRRTAAARAPRAASLPAKPAAPATPSVRPLGPSRGIGSEKLQPPSRLPGTPGLGTTSPSRWRETNAPRRRRLTRHKGAQRPRPLCVITLALCRDVHTLQQPKEQDCWRIRGGKD